MGGVFPVGSEMDAPEAGEGEEKPLGDVFREGIGDGSVPFLLDGHAGGEGADFEGVRAGELVGCGGGQGLDDCFLELGGEGVHGCGFQGVEFVEFVWETF